ncbi:MAG: UDP-D-galactose:(glucosyl)lipopolysaccharide-1,6-D-galactosyltransferase [Acidobacteria bacterium ADurb.Bin051]|nr:MAG: UDP-D-galactose:(glucosyl)lipopolysaccharide-1,6-D-galactosyltransferase [Acidobacteria bacterium ADurb.Bin051]
MSRQGSERTRVLFLTRGWPSRGGTEVWLDTLVGQLRAHGVEVEVGVAEGARFNDPDELFAASRFVRSGHVLDGCSGWREGRRYRVRRLLERLRPAVVAPLRLQDGLHVASREKARHGFRIVYPLHEYRAGYFQDLVDYGSWIDRVVVCDELSRRAVIEVAGLEESQVTLITQGVAPGSGRRTAEPGPLRLGYVGRLEESQKRVSDLVAVCRALDRRGVKFLLRIVGAGPEERTLKENLRPWVEKGSVEMLPWQSPAILAAEFYPAIDVLVLTSSRETGPIVAWEAMAAGALLVTARYRGLEAAGFLVSGENCLIYEIGDCDDAAAQIEMVARDAQLRRRLAAAGRERVERERSLEGVARSWLTLFERLRTEPPRQGTRPLPAGEPNGSRLGRMGLPVPVVEGVRRFVGRRFLHASPGEEWPFHSVPGQNLNERLQSELNRLDTRGTWRRGK